MFQGGAHLVHFKGALDGKGSTYSSNYGKGKDSARTI